MRFWDPPATNCPGRPDGKQLAFAAAGPRHYSNLPPLDPPNGNDVMVVDRLLYKTDYYYSDLRRTRVWVDSRQKAKKATQVSSGDYDYHSIDWALDGKWIVAVSNRTGEDDYNSNNDLVRLSPSDGQLVQLTHTPGPEYAPSWSPDSLQVAYLARKRDTVAKKVMRSLKKVYVLGATASLRNLPKGWTCGVTIRHGQAMAVRCISGPNTRARCCCIRWRCVIAGPFQ